MSNQTLQVFTPRGREHLVPENLLPDILVTIYGGWTPEQVADAMEAQSRVRAGQTVTANGYTLKLIQEH